MNEQLKRIIELTKCGVHVSVNNHRDFYETVAQYLDRDNFELDPAIKAEMIASDTVVEVQCYAHTPVGAYLVLDHDIDRALTKMLEILERRISA